MIPNPTDNAKITLPDVPFVAINATEAAILSADGEIDVVSHEQARLRINNQPVIVCHAPYTRTRLGVNDLHTYDLLELYAFIYPAQFTVPTPSGLAKSLGLAAPATFEDYPMTLMEAAQLMLQDLSKEQRHEKRANPVDIARAMGLQGKGWNWTPYVCSALGEDYDPKTPISGQTAMNVWKHLPEWAEEAPTPPPSHHAVTGDDSRKRLAEILNEGDKKTEPRPQQIEYATAMTAAFSPLQEAEDPHVILAEAGTGVGKTLGYLAPSHSWVQKNEGTVWISTYTKNLQRQIVQELDRVYPNPDLKSRKMAVRKGRENYLCLLNLEDETAGAATARTPHHAIGAGLMARWAEATESGDMQGGDFPGWLPGLLGYRHSLGLSDRRGECIYGACDHYKKCFVERSIRKAEHAEIVVANHALVMIQTAIAGPDETLPQRYIFDEGHHLFHAADSAFSAHLTAREGTDLRRWILGNEGGKKTRARGLKKRLEDLIASDEHAENLLQQILYKAQVLPSFNWSRRLKDEKPAGVTEEFLNLVYKQVFARAAGRDGPYSLETDTRPLIDELPPTATKLQNELRKLQQPMRDMVKHLRKKLTENAETWDSDTKKRTESVVAGLERRSEMMLQAWIQMLGTLLQDEDNETYVDWMEIERMEGQAYDIGLYRHYVDPMAPFAAAIKPHAHGIGITSATLRDRSQDSDDEQWKSPLQRTGAPYLSSAPTIFETPSPYDYEKNTRVFIVNDIRKDNIELVAKAYQSLFLASGGGALGLFTAIQRLRAVHGHITKPLEEKGLHLYAQHIDEMDTGTLVDIFRDDTHACLLGTDAVRDGIDVPGESLRLLVYDRVPWPRPTILHKARRKNFGGRSYDEMLTRMKLRQAFGRLVRKGNDRGVFIMVDSMLPTRLLTAFPDGVPIERLGLADCLEKVDEFLAE